MSDDIETLRRVETEPDYIHVKRFEYSLRQMEAKYPDGDAPDKTVAAALCMQEEEVGPAMERITSDLRALMGVESPGDDHTGTP